jgi:hypothetical protein
MRNWHGNLSPFGKWHTLSSVSALLAYAANSITPQLVADFKDGVYGKNSGLSTFGDVLNHARNGNATMVDADGLLKWAPHNFASYSAIDTDNWSSARSTITSVAAPNPLNLINVTKITPKVGSNDCTEFALVRGQVVPVDIPVTYSALVKSDGFPIAIVMFTDRPNVYGGVAYNLESETLVELAGGNRGTLIDPFITDAGNGWYRIGFTQAGDGAKDSTSGIAVSFAPAGLGSTVAYVPSDFEGDGVLGGLTCGASITRSDLGGMVNNPATGDSYVPTTDAARFLPRENHHVYNGSAWVKEGYLHEPEAATNLAPYSNDFSQWSEPTIATSGQTNSLTGAADATLLETTGGINRTFLTIANALANVETSFSVFAKAGTTDWIILYDLGYPSSAAWFDLASVAVGTVQTNASAIIEDLGGGWRRCSIQLKNPANYTPRLTIEVVTADGDGGAANGENVYIYGAQREASSVPTSYIPTAAGSTVTRAADTLTLPVANIPYPEPVVIGPELVTNGDFATDSDWTKETGWTIAGGVASFDPTGQVGNSLLTQDVGITWTGATLGDIADNGAYEYLTTASDGTSYSVRLTVSGMTVTGLDQLRIIVSGTTFFASALGGRDFSGSIDNISVREINPLAVSFGYKSLVTYADLGASVTSELIEWVKDSSDNIVLRLDTDSGTGDVVLDRKSVV